MVVVPIICLITSFDDKFTSPDEIWYPIISCSLLALFNFTVIQIGFWEKLFSKVTVSCSEVVWKCPMRRTKRLLLSECVEIGAFLEHENRGIPVEQIYFSDCKNVDLSRIRKMMRFNSKVIVFWYSEALYRHIKQTMNSHITSRLVAYRIQKRQKGCSD